MKKLSILLLVITCAGCTTKNDDIRPPLLNTDSFEEYDPWWNTNNTEKIEECF